MAIDLPPVIPPQASSAERIEQYAALNTQALIEVKIGEYNLRISGNQYLTREQIEAVMASATSPAQAVNALNQAYYQLGHLLVTVYFAQRDKTTYAHVINGHLAAIKAPDYIYPYFSELIGDDDLSKTDFDSKRVLANLRSDRAGHHYAVSYQLETDPSAFTLIFAESENADHDSTEASLSANNYGNRFLGRYFANASLKHSFENGFEASMTYDRALTEYGDDNGGDYYDGYTFNLNYPSVYGFYGLEARYIEYESSAEVVAADGSEPDANAPPSSLNLCSILGVACDLSGGLLDIDVDLGIPGSGGTTSSGLNFYSETHSVALTGEQVISSDGWHRLTVSQRLEKIGSSIDIRGIGRALDEPQTTLELGIKYNKLMSLFGVVGQLNTQGLVEVGLGSDKGTLDTDPREGVVAIGRRSGQFVILKPRAGLKMAVSNWATVNLDFIGQFSNDTQLPLQQQFFLGGSSGLSAYLPGVLVGDSGSYVKLAFAANAINVFGINLSPEIFVEHGQAWYENASGSAGDVRAIADLGIKLKADIGEHFSSELMAARPFTDNNLDQAVLSNLEVDFFWRLKFTF
jgi:hypothetical protein